MGCAHVIRMVLLGLSGVVVGSLPLAASDSRDSQRADRQDRVA